MRHSRCYPLVEAKGGDICFTMDGKSGNFQEAERICSAPKTLPLLTHDARRRLFDVFLWTADTDGSPVWLGLFRDETDKTVKIWFWMDGRELKGYLSVAVCQLCHQLLNHNRPWRLYHTQRRSVLVHMLSQRETANP